MNDSVPPLFPIETKLVDDLYLEAMVLADEARAYLETEAMAERAQMTPLVRLNFSCESLKVTTRLMQVIAWLLSRRALARGEISLVESREDKFRLGAAEFSDPELTRGLPTEMRTLIAVSESLYKRAQRLEDQLCDRDPVGAMPGNSPARDLMLLLETAF